MNDNLCGSFGSDDMDDEIDGRPNAVDKSDLGTREAFGNGKMNLINVAADLSSALAAAEQIPDYQHRWIIMRHKFEYFMGSVVKAVEQIEHKQQEQSLTPSRAMAAAFNPNMSGSASNQGNNLQYFKAGTSTNIQYVKVKVSGTAKNINILAFSKLAKNFKIGDLYFPSIGQAYQYIRLMNVGKWELAQRVRMYNSGMKAFRLGEMECRYNLEWTRNLRKLVMLMILKKFSEQFPVFVNALRKNGPGTRYLVHFTRSFWGSDSKKYIPETDSKPDKNLYGVCLEELADAILTGRPLPELPNADAILACCNWQVGSRPPGTKVLVVADRQLQCIQSGASNTELIHVSEMTLSAAACGNPGPDCRTVQSMLQHWPGLNLHEFCCIILAVTSNDVLSSVPGIDQAYTQLLAWLVQDTEALIYIVGGYPRKFSGAWNPAVSNGNNALRSVCQKFPGRANFIDIPAMIQRCAYYLEESVYMVQFLDPEADFSELETEGQVRLASLIGSAVPVCTLLYTGQLRIFNPLTKRLAENLLASGKSYSNRGKIDARLLHEDSRMRIQAKRNRNLSDEKMKKGKTRGSPNPRFEKGKGAQSIGANTVELASFSGGFANVQAMNAGPEPSLATKCLGQASWM